MEILTEFDGLQDALKKVKMDENVLPYVNGRLCDTDSWNKTQKILNCPEMITAHKYLYNLDMDQLTEEEIEKIDQLYKLGCDRGFIVDDLTDWNAEEAPDKVEDKVEVAVEEPAKKPVGGTLFKAKVPCWTVIYSATSKDGEIKTGEAYSNAISASAAKADVNAKLSRIGYSNIAILAIEAASECDCSKCDEEDIEENDMLRNRPHNAHIDDPKGVVAENDEEKEEEKSKDKDDAKADEEADASNEEASDEDTSSEDAEESSDEKQADGADASDEDNSDAEESTEDDRSKDDTDDTAEDGKSDDASDEETSDEESSDEEAGEEEASDEETSDEDEDKEDELDANEKAELKDKYRKTFKNTLVKCKFDTSFNDLTLEQKVKFFTELSKAWKKNEPNEFMTDKEIEQLNNVVVKSGND